MTRLLLPILLLAALVRFAWLGHDLPLALEATNAPAQDAFWYLEAAQARADGSGVDPLAAYDRPLWVAIGRVWFAAFGTGLESTQALAAAMGVLSVLAVYVALARASRRAALLASLLLATSYPFAGLARSPLIYTPLAALMALVFLLHGGSWRAKAAAWLLLFLLVLAFKGVAVAMVPGLLLRDLASIEKRKRPWVLAGSLVAIPVALVLVGVLEPVELLRNKERMERYLNHSLGPESWRRLVLAPEESGLVALAPGLLGLAAVGATRWRRPLVLGALGWAATVIFGLALLDYRPLRFYALAGPPLAILAGTGADALLAAGERKKKAPLAAGLVVANAAAFFLHGTARELAAPLGVGAALLVALVPLPPLQLARRLAVSLLVLVIGLDLVRDAEMTPTTLETGNQLVREVLGPRAVLVGPYASALAAGAHGLERRRAPGVRGGPMAALGLACVASGGFTHVALDRDQEASGQLCSGFSGLGEPPVLLLAFPVRGELVYVYRFQGAASAGYELSPVEKAFEERDEVRALRALAPSRDLVFARFNALTLLGRQPEAELFLRAFKPD